MAYKSKYSGAEIDNTIDKVDNLDTKLSAFSSNTVNEITRLDTSLNRNTLRKTRITVGEDETTVKTFLNGVSTNYYDNTHGTMIYAGGIPTGLTLLPQRVQSASTKIYEDGYLETKTGKIGNFKMDNLTLTETSQGKVKIASTTVGLKHNTEGTARFVLESSPSQNIPYLEVNKNLILTNNLYYNESIAAKISNRPNSLSGDGKTYAALEVDGRDVAIKAENGQFAGLRPRYRRITSSDILSKYDHTIECMRTDGGQINLTLPANPEKGQCYEIWKWGTCAISIRGNGKNIIRVGISNTANQGVGVEWVGVIKLVYRGNETDVNNWLMTLHRTE